MALPAELLRELVLRLKTDSVRRRVSDKRVAPRVGLRARVEVGGVGERVARPLVWVRDLSAKGIGVLVREKWAVGTEFVVPFEREGEAGPVKLLYRVRHVARVGEELYAVGGRLICVAEGIGRAKGRGAA